MPGAERVRRVLLRSAAGLRPAVAAAAAGVRARRPPGGGDGGGGGAGVLLLRLRVRGWRCCGGLRLSGRSSHHWREPPGPAGRCQGRRTTAGSSLGSGWCRGRGEGWFMSLTLLRRRLRVIRVCKLARESCAAGVGGRHGRGGTGLFLARGITPGPGGEPCPSGLGALGGSRLGVRPGAGRDDGLDVGRFCPGAPGSLRERWRREKFAKKDEEN